MRLLDTREQKSPRFLMDAFPDISITVLEVGDYFSGTFEQIPVMRCGYKSEMGWSNNPNCVKCDGVMNQVCVGRLECPEHESIDHYKNGKIENGCLVEIKIGKDFGIHTEQLERFQDELYRMSCWRQQNPHVQLHAVWGVETASSEEQRLFLHLCFQYHVWGHLLVGWEFEGRIIKLLKALDQDSQYKEFEPYIKRSHEEPTLLGKMLRQVDGMTSERAIEGAEHCEQKLYNLYKRLEFINETVIVQADSWVIDDICGLTQANEPTALNTAFTQFVEGKP